MFAEVAAVLVMGFLVWAYQVIKPPPPKICGSPNGPAVTAPRIRLSDGRHLAYKESGVEKEKAKHKVILSHGFNSSKDFYLPISQEVAEELEVYILTFDRAGYGESDPNPKRTLKSDVLDIEELADKLQLGSKFYLAGLSVGTSSIWGSVRYIPHRLAGVALVSPVINFWWPSLPSKLCNKFFKKRHWKDQLGFSIAHYAPGLFWVLQKALPCPVLMSLKDFIEKNPGIYNKNDIETFEKMARASSLDGPSANVPNVQQQGIYECLCKDIIVFYSNWGFDPTELENPFPNGEGHVHLWQGDDDGMAPCEMQRFVTKKLPWIQYHEVPGGGHLIIHDSTYCEAIFRTLFRPPENAIIEG